MDLHFLASPVSDCGVYRISKAAPIVRFGNHWGTGHLLVNTLDGAWVIVAGDEHNRDLADLSQPPCSLYSFAAPVEANVHQSHIRLDPHGERTSVAVR